jgi:hypothetical protein
MTPERRKAVWAIYGMEKLKILLIAVDLKLGQGVLALILFCLPCSVVQKN